MCESKFRPLTFSLFEARGIIHFALLNLNSPSFPPVSKNPHPETDQRRLSPLVRSLNRATPDMRPRNLSSAELNCKDNAHPFLGPLKTGRSLISLNFAVLSVHPCYSCHLACVCLALPYTLSTTHSPQSPLISHKNKNQIKFPASCRSNGILYEYK